MNQQMTEQARKRLIERHCAAAIRAIAGMPAAELRHALLYCGDQRVPFLTPYLAFDATEDPVSRCRGSTDAMALRLTHSDRALHAALLPEGTVAAIVFDTLEQIRVESLAPKTLPGLQQNLDDTFKIWCRKSRSSGLPEHEIGLLIYSIIQMVRSRFTGASLEEEVEGLIEATRFSLGPLIGPALKSLSGLCHDQTAYARPALAIACKVQAMAGVLAGGKVSANTVRIIRQLMLPHQPEEIDSPLQAGQGEPTAVELGQSPPKYDVFCRQYDREVSGWEVVPVGSRRRALREELDRLARAQTVSIPRLAQRLKSLFSGFVQAGWNFGEEDGYLDGRRLSQMVANPAYRRIFRHHQTLPKSETVVSFLIDNSGSMKRQHYVSVAVLVDIYSRALDLAGIPHEILGYTTAGWNGGQSIRVWRRAGQPEFPGRLNDRLHVVYKDVKSPWRRARESIASLISTHHFREGLDGEALEWAVERLRRYPAKRRCLVMISDGAPMDTVTTQYNPQGFLDNHFREIIRQVEKGGEIELRAIGNHLDLDEYFSRSLVLDFTGTLGNSEFNALETLYRGRQLH